MTLHTKISYIKSGLRILAYFFMLFGPGIVQLAGVVLILAEVLGIIEEAHPGAYKGTETTAPVVPTYGLATPTRKRGSRG